MIKTLRVTNFKSIQDMKVDISDFNIVVGLNGAGKTNLIQSIAFIKDLVSGQDINEAARKITTTPQELFNRNTTSKEFSMSVTFSDKDENEYLLEFVIGFGKEDKISRAIFRVLSEKLENITEGKLIYHRNEDKIENGERKPIPLNIDKEHLVISLYLDNDAKNAKKAFSYIFMPSENTIDSRESIVLESTRGLAGIITRLRNHKPEDYKKFQIIISKLIPSFSAVSDPQTMSDTEVSADPEENKYYLVLFEEKDLKGKLSMKSISTGDVRTSFIVATALAVREGSTIIIEELENGIHPKRAKDLIQYIDKISKVRNLQIIFTTHSPTIINTVRVQDIIFVEKRGEMGTQVVSFRNIEQQSRIKEILEDGGELTDYLAYKSKI